MWLEDSPDLSLDIVPHLTPQILGLHQVGQALDTAAGLKETQHVAVAKQAVQHAPALGARDCTRRPIEPVVWMVPVVGWLHRLHVYAVRKVELKFDPAVVDNIGLHGFPHDVAQ